ncbi:MAG: DUF11 domain-containing protein [Candidatus Scalindua sp. AMX11]|nr:MAG: DUF11 domain-containing protein [Candidatus Scalindua sp.]NOG83330.1 DUF11 domain-containing protein [Planctomycetota bacterium]RZV76770.1 MAG: DUF11 domain-containing protein [Candidatus Scalindua sp. SCAELEC01]TDE63954.1 MAG: DUF11 domain-containing protein [Candidatus Scalindua sp. AMX11]GJQ60246.1 MAG: hypothetical protein SCALA701_30470 [Candidatus Scalindua sp.]
MQRIVISLFLVMVLIAGCKIVPVTVPNNVFTLLDEAVAVRTKGPVGQDLKNVKISLKRLQKIEYMFDNVMLLHYKGNNLKMIPHKQEGDNIFANLVGGEIYIIRAIIPGLVDTYDVLCGFDKILVKRPNLIDFWETLCPEIFCPPNAFPATDLFKKFPQLNEFSNDLALEGRVIGGYDDLYPSGNICDNCNKNKEGVIVATDCDEVKVKDCFDLSLKKSVNPSSPKVGDHVTYEITLTNMGNCSAASIEVRDILPNGVTYVSDNSNGSYNTNTGIWEIGSLGARNTVNLEIEVQVNQSGKIVNRAKAFVRGFPAGSNAQAVLIVSP